MKAKDRRTVLAVFEALGHKSHDELNMFLGSITILEMQNLYTRLKYEEYCEAKGLSYEGLTDEEMIDAYMDICGYR